MTEIYWKVDHFLPKATDIRQNLPNGSQVRIYSATAAEG